MLKGYYYLFYKIYRFSEAAPSKWLSEWKAGLVIIVLEIWIFLSLLIYYAVCTRTIIALDIKHPLVMFILALIFVFNYYSFYHNDKWKSHVAEFDQWTESKNKRGGLMVYGVILAIVINLILSFFLLSKIDWALYR